MSSNRGIYRVDTDGTDRLRLEASRLRSRRGTPVDRWFQLAGAALLGPGLAALVSEPRTPDPTDAGPPEPPTEPPSSLQHWAPRFAAVLVLSILIPLLGRVI